ncbi:helix-turn-helix domain-containing protein [Aeromonas veronii]
MRNVGYTFNLNHKSVYCFLLNYQMMSGKVFPSYKHIQDNLGIGSDNTVKKYLDELEEMGLVKATSRKGTSKIYELVTLADFNALDTEEQQTRKQPNKNLHIKPVENKAAESVITNPVNQHPLSVEQNELRDPFLDDCGVSHTKPAQSVAPTKPKDNAYGNGYGRKCQHCYQNSNGDWDCKDDWCSNCIPF